MSFGARIPILARSDDDVGCAVAISERSGAVYVAACGDEQQSGFVNGGAIYRVNSVSDLDNMQVITAPDASYGARFGSAIAMATIDGIMGDVLLIGAPEDWHRTGAAYIFYSTTANGVPAFTRRLMPSDPRIDGQPFQRCLAARANYLTADRPDCKYAAKEHASLVHSGAS